MDNNNKTTKYSASNSLRLATNLFITYDGTVSSGRHEEGGGVKRIDYMRAQTYIQSVCTQEQSIILHLQQNIYTDEINTNHRSPDSITQREVTNNPRGGGKRNRQTR